MQVEDEELINRRNNESPLAAAMRTRRLMTGASYKTGQAREKMEATATERARRRRGTAHHVLDPCSQLRTATGGLAHATPHDWRLIEDGPSKGDMSGLPEKFGEFGMQVRGGDPLSRGSRGLPGPGS